MDCRNIQRVIYEFIFNEADERKLLAIQKHLDRCQECQEEAQAIASILRRLKEAARQDPIPEGARDRMLKEIHRKASVKAGAAGQDGDIGGA